LKVFFGSKNLGHLTGGIIQVAKMHGLAFTADNTERLKTLVDSMDTKVAFFYHFLFSIVKDGIVRANFNARLTSIAIGLIENNRSIFSFYKSCRRTDIHTRRVGAVIAKMGQKIHF
jgi:hypothetical protein